MDKPRIVGESQALPKRGISAEVCKRFHYQVGTVPNDYPCHPDSTIAKMKGKTVHIENFYDGEGNLVGQKLRDKDKNFAVIGDIGDRLFGSHTIKKGGKVLMVTEGAIDCMSYAEVRKNWDVVSIPNGAAAAAKAIKANVPLLESFEKVVFCFDNDEAGQNALEACKGILSPGKMHIAALPGEYKDLNEALVAGDVKAFIHAVSNAESVRPSGLVEVDDIIEEAMKPIEWGLPWFLKTLTKLTYGRRYGEIYGIGAPTGGGKTDFLTEQIAYDVTELGLNVGVFFLEQKPTETVKRIAGKLADRRFHVPDDGWTLDELREAANRLRGKITFYDSFGETDWTEVKTRIRHVHMTKGTRIFYVDHLTAMADTADEKGSLEQIMKELAGLANELNVIITFVSHLTTPDGTPHEEGGRIAVRHFKGSRSIGFWSFYLFGLERNQQAEDEGERHTTTFRILKDRYTGQATGVTFPMGYLAATGRVIPPEVMGFEKPQKDEEF
ncbi:toprim domain-containing protein [Xinfangfangia sp. CPCC 101601]|uniref:Toprim domain-containing protein n=1 Tax=Pseudogemmobacter lacusdianii TaxID=3069608 RepID=A0ABU0VZU6_9RHOB|nr:toprim domain-containing protein [Xinfangfangia sp. CPCC 101601]MDQ2066715.1 toprim domain-containing protein [Xinfangfangia sp. CPCC 101601]